MRIAAIISEFDPFHNGHKNLIDETRRRADCGGVVCIMSGSFTQRGKPAVCDKWARAEMALKGGADVVVELPFVYAVSSAQFFALGGVSIADKLGADVVSFGIESAEADVLEAAEKRKSGEYGEKVLANIKKGASYASAASSAIDSERIKPNDILACEYIAAMESTGFRPGVLMIPRRGAGHGSEEPSGEFASATALRKMLAEGDIGRISGYVPYETAEILGNWAETERFVTADDFSSALCVKLRTMRPDRIEELPFGGGGLNRLVYNNAQKYSSWEKIVSASTSLRYPSSRASRFMTMALVYSEDLAFSPKELERIYTHGEAPYIRVLGVTRGRGEEVLSEIARRCEGRAKLVTAPYKYLENTRASGVPGYKMLMTDISAQAVYDSVLKADHLSAADRDLTCKFLRYDF